MVPAIVSEELFEAAQRISYDNSKWSPRRAEPDHWLLRGLIKCGHCSVSVSCHKMRGRNGTFHYYYYCRNHDPLRAGGEDRRCPERNIRADELDAFVFDQVRTTMLRPDMLLSGEAVVSAQCGPGDDKLLATQLARLDRKLDSVTTERRRLADLYQASFIEREELLRRGKELGFRRGVLDAQRQALIDQGQKLAHQNQLRERVEGFANKVRASIDQLDFDQRQKLLRLVVEEVRVSGWQVQIRLRIPLDSSPEPPDKRVSSKDRLRSLHVQDVDVMGEPVEQRAGEPLAAEHAGPFVEGKIAGDDGAAALIALAEDLEQHLRAAGRQRHICGVKACSLATYVSVKTP